MPLQLTCNLLGKQSSAWCFLAWVWVVSFSKALYVFFFASVLYLFFVYLFALCICFYFCGLLLEPALDFPLVRVTCPLLTFYAFPTSEALALGLRGILILSTPKHLCAVIWPMFVCACVLFAEVDISGSESRSPVTYLLKLIYSTSGHLEEIVSRN